MEKKFDIKKLKYIKGAIESDMSDEDIIKWLKNVNYTTEDFYQIIKILLKDRNELIRKIENPNSF